MEKKVAIGLIEAINTRDPEIIAAYYNDHKDYDSYFKDPNRRKRMTFAHINDKYDTKEEFITLIKRMYTFLGEVFPGYTFTINHNWIVQEGEKILIPCNFKDTISIKFQKVVHITWVFRIKGNYFLSGGYLGGHSLFDDLPTNAGSTDNNHNKAVIADYLQGLRNKGIIQ